MSIARIIDEWVKYMSGIIVIARDRIGHERNCLRNTYYATKPSWTALEAKQGILGDKRSLKAI